MGDWFTWLLNSALWLQSLPWLMLGLLLVPLAVLGFWKRIFPHTPLVLLLIAPALLSLGILVRQDMILVVLAMDVALLVAAIADLVSLPAAGSLDAERSTLRIVSVQQRHPVTLTVVNRSSRSWHVVIRDDVPQEFTATPDELVRRLPPRSRVTLHYELRASRRGSFTMDRVYVRVRSWLGLWYRLLSYPASSVLHVYPDMKQLSEYSILARTNRLSLMGVRRMRRVGQDHDFERLRDYTPDDNYKHIDWRTTARRNKLTVKDYQTSQSQRIIFLLDCGRMMTNQAAGLSLLDHSLNALLMLSYVALQKGDSVGLICFSDEVHNYVPPRGGMSQMNKLLHASFNRFPQLVESRYDQAFFYLASHCKKRSLVVLMTNLIDEVNANQVEQYLSTLVGRHLPLGVLMRDHRLFDAAEQLPPHDAALYRAAAAAHILNWRQQLLTDLQHKGVLSLDVFPEEMTAPLVNQYLEIKARHLL